MRVSRSKPELGFSDVRQEFYFDKKRVARTIEVGGSFFETRFPRVPKVREASTNFFVSYLGSRASQNSAAKGRRITFIDLFCGGGGLTLGTHQMLECFGFQPKMLAAVDLDIAALKLTSEHFNPIISSSAPVEELIRCSVDHSRELDNFITLSKVLDNQLHQFKGKTNLLIGGPPCQGHSNLNNKTRRNDPRNDLYFIMPAFAIAMDIPCIIIENVKHVTSASNNVVGITKNILFRNGYFVDEIMIKAMNYGVAQTRERHFLVASKIEKPGVRQILSSLRTNPLSFDDINAEKYNATRIPEIMLKNGLLSPENESRIEYLHSNNTYDLPNKRRPKCHQNGHTYKAVYGRIHGDQPLSTVTTGFCTPGRGRYVHPHERRVINIREAARAQAFPDWYWKPVEKLEIKRSNLYKIIGDAVPSLMVTPLITALYKSLKDC